MGQTIYKVILVPGSGREITHSLNEHNDIIVPNYKYKGQLRYHDKTRCYFIKNDFKYVFSLSELPHENIRWLIDYVPDGIVYQYPMKCSLCQVPHVTSDKTRTDYFEGKHYMYPQGSFGISTNGEIFYNSPLPEGTTYLSRTEDFGILDKPHKLSDLHSQKTIHASLYIFSIMTHRYKYIGTGKIKWCHNMYELTISNPDGTSSIYYARRSVSHQEKFLQSVFNIPPKLPYEPKFDDEINTNEYYIPIIRS